MAEKTEPADAQVRASVRDAVRKLTEPVAVVPKDGVGPEGQSEPDEPAPPQPESA